MNKSAWIVSDWDHEFMIVVQAKTKAQAVAKFKKNVDYPVSHFTFKRVVMI